MSNTPSFLFVCMGNICRSPMAEGAFRMMAQERGVTVDCDSAGTGAWHVGNPPDQRAQQVAARHGADISGLRARQVTADDFHRFTHILALDQDNLANLGRIRPQDAGADLSLLLDHVPGRAGQAVADPYYGATAGFETTWTEVLSAAEALLDRFVTGR